MAALIAMRERERGWGPWARPSGEGKRKVGLGVDGAWRGVSCGTRPSGGSSMAAVPGRAWERQGKGERELAGGPAHGVGLSYQ
jgi:hypothetical protein